jgi:hypothetical protein
MMARKVCAKAPTQSPSWVRTRLVGCRSSIILLMQCLLVEIVESLDA